MKYFTLLLIVLIPKLSFACDFEDAYNLSSAAANNHAKRFGAVSYWGGSVTGEQLSPNVVRYSYQYFFFGSNGQKRVGNIKIHPNCYVESDLSFFAQEVIVH